MSLVNCSLFIYETNTDGSGNVLGVGDIAVTKAGKNPCLLEAYILRARQTIREHTIYLY